MCGFAGEFLLGAGRADVRTAAAMADRLAHRGPDEEATFLSPDGRCAIGLRRLAVIDPAGSRQPMTSASGTATVAFNGEIYNFRELRAELAGDGAAFRTEGDTEVLLHLYERFGREMLGRLDGMFAFVMYDHDAGTLLLARDRLGQKPLWYAVLPDRVVFASEAKGLLRHPGVPGDICPTALTYYLTMGYIPSPRAAWAAVRKLPPGCRMEVADACGPAQRYWSPQPEPADDGREPAAQLRERLARSVESHMVADVPLGALLSGGLDSSIVVALMSRAAGAAGGIRTFTAGFDDAAFDERPAAGALAARCGTDHVELRVSPAAPGTVDRIVGMYDEPFGDSSALPTWLICRAARQYVTVTLTGDGGDEVFGGYDRYRAMGLADGMAAPKYLAIRLAAAAVRPWAGADERSRARRFLRFAGALPHPYAVQYFMYRRLFGPADLGRLLDESFAESVDVEEPARWFCDLYEAGDLPDEVAMAQRHDLLTYLPDDLLVKTDMASMATSLELRAPMLDHRLVGLGLSLPPEQKVARGRGKVILREAFADMLPPEAARRPKRGFAVPLGRWLREQLREELTETLLDEGLAARGIFRKEALAGLINDHLGGRGDHRHRLWALLVLARWLSRQA